MIDQIPKSVATVYTTLCNKFKLPSWKSRVFLVNAILMIDKLEKRIDALERQIVKLKKNK